jgi:hypothetical protein
VHFITQFHPDEVLTYLEKYSKIRDRWWELALKRRESRANFDRYIGKRKALDSFFASTKKKLEKLFPKARIEIAYGHAYEKMNPSGKGEIAVPTHGTYKACRRIFGNKNVTVTDEYMSTKGDFETGEMKEAAYLKVGGEKKEDGTWEFTNVLCHTNSKYMPKVEEKDIEAVKAYSAMAKEKNKARRKGQDVSKVKVLHAEEKETMGSRNYPEVRGLRFSTKRRIYVGRDLSAAMTIARLRTLEMTGKKRPSLFCRVKQSQKTNSVLVGEMRKQNGVGATALSPVHS